MAYYISCENCLSGYEENLQNCPTCNAEKDGLKDAKIIFSNEVKVELSKLGGLITNFFYSTSNPIHVIMPCEWGVVVLNTETNAAWSFLAGLVAQIELIDTTIVIHTGIKEYQLDLFTGAQYL